MGVDDCHIKHVKKEVEVLWEEKCKKESNKKNKKLIFLRLFEFFLYLCIHIA